MTLNLLLLLLLLSGSGGIALGGALMSMLGWILLVVVLVFIWEYKLRILLVLGTIITILCIKKVVSDYFKYKDETPEEREERLKMNKMIKEWRDRNNF